MGYQPDPPRQHFAIVGRNLLWGLYLRMLDGDVIYESWLWGAYRRRKLVVLAPQLSAGDRAAFNAIGETIGGTLPTLFATPAEARVESARRAVREAREAVEAFKAFNAGR